MQVQEVERIPRPVATAKSQILEPPVGDILEIPPHLAQREPGDALLQKILRERRLARDGLGEHLRDALLELPVEELRVLVADRPYDVEREPHVHRLVAENPVRARRQTVEQPARA